MRNHTPIQPLLATRSTLYLDFDGVLHPDPVYRRKDGTLFVGQRAHPGAQIFMWAPELEYRVVERDVQIVLSTNWVRRLGFQRTVQFLPPAIAVKVVGSTYHSARRLDWDAYSRYQQIQQHATRHGIENWLALENDVIDWAPMARHHLCVCDDTTGMSLQGIALDAWLEKNAPSMKIYSHGAVRVDAAMELAP